MLKILLLGPQGCGKGTVGKLLSEKLQLPLVSAGDLLREIPKSHPRYQENLDLMNKGELSPFDLVADLLISRTNLDDCHDGYILDGWARDMDNLNYFNPGFEKVLFLNISLETTLKRLTSRRTCSLCGAVYNIITVKPKVEGVCDKCGGKLIQRDDDTEKAIRERLDIFHNRTMPVIEHFKKLGTLIEINAEPKPEEVAETALKALNMKNDNY